MLRLRGGMTSGGDSLGASEGAAGDEAQQGDLEGLQDSSDIPSEGTAAPGGYTFCHDIVAVR